MYKLIVFDFDGTLVSRGKSLDDNIIENIKKWQKKKIEVLVASGRTFRSLKKEFKDFDLEIPLISNNGNMLRMLKSEKLIFKRKIEIQLLKKAMSVFNNYNVKPIFHVDGYESGYDLVLLDTLDDITKNYVGYYDNRYKIISFEELLKEEVLSIVSYVDIEKYEKICKDLKIFSSKITTHHLTNGISHSGMMEIVGEDSNKWNTVNEYAKKRGIFPKEIIAVGDDTNDLPMIENAGIGIAMKSSSDLVKEKANFITSEDADKYSGITMVNRILQEVNNEN